jgi:hypothetical protein
MDTLRKFFSSRDVSLDIKLKLYLTPPLNTVLWGCEAWALLKPDLHKLEVSHHRSIQHILGISLKRVIEEIIINEEAINRFMQIPTIAVLIPQVRPAHNYPNSPWEMIHPPGGDNAVCM